jgi:hypothetical protein
MRQLDAAMVIDTRDEITATGVVDRIAIKNGSQVVTFCGAFNSNRPTFVRRFSRDGDGQMWGKNVRRLMTFGGHAAPPPPRDEWGPL